MQAAARGGAHCGLRSPATSAHGPRPPSPARRRRLRDARSGRRTGCPWPSLNQPRGGGRREQSLGSAGGKGTGQRRKRKRMVEPADYGVRSVRRRERSLGPRAHEGEDVAAQPGPPEGLPRPSSPLGQNGGAGRTAGRSRSPRRTRRNLPALSAAARTTCCRCPERRSIYTRGARRAAGAGVGVGDCPRGPSLLRAAPPSRTVGPPWGAGTPHSDRCPPLTARCRGIG